MRFSNQTQPKTGPEGTRGVRSFFTLLPSFQGFVHVARKGGILCMDAIGMGMY